MKQKTIKFIHKYFSAVKASKNKRSCNQPIFFIIQERSDEFTILNLLKACKNKTRFTKRKKNRYHSKPVEIALKNRINFQFQSIMQSNKGLKEKSMNGVKKTVAPDSKEVLLKLDQLKNQIKNTLLQEESLNGKPTLLKKPSINSSKATSNGSFTNGQDVSKINQIRKNIIGFNTAYISPFNIQLQSVYVDHTATNRAYQSVEDIIKYAKLYAANPHTEFSHFGKYSTQMMHYAHDSLLKSFSACRQEFVALPTGSGSTGAIEKAIKFIKSLEKQYLKPSIYITPYEHHSNILPWIEFFDNVNILASDKQGNLIMNEIEKQLLSDPTNEVIVSASAASNVTSTITDLQALNAVIKKVRKSKKILFAVDCAAYCCHHQLNLKVFDQIDFAFLSPHKNLGGAETCGVLIARKNIVKNAKPTFPGGGTVAFVKGYSKQDVMYDVDIFNREIAGTPPFLGFYRAALSFELLKNQIGYDFIHEREKFNTALFMKRIQEANANFKQRGLNKHIVIYGDSDFEHRANVVTFNLLTDGAIVQHSFASLIFADVFGIQLRSGCFCAGPFGMQLLNLDDETAQIIEEEVSVGILRDKPGYMRLDLTFYLEPFEIEYIAAAIIGVAEFSKKMELVYTICNDGQIKRHKLFKNILNDNYSLSCFQKAAETVQKQQDTNEERLLKREETLTRQLKRGLLIVENPVQFLKSQVQK